MSLLLKLLLNMVLFLLLLFPPLIELIINLISNKLKMILSLFTLINIKTKVQKFKKYIAGYLFIYSRNKINKTRIKQVDFFVKWNSDLCKNI